MEETKEQKQLHSMLVSIIYFLIVLEIIVMIYGEAPWWGKAAPLMAKLHKLPIYHSVFYSKFFILFLICVVSIGTRSKKKLDLNPKKQITLPLFIGLLLFFGSIVFFPQNDPASIHTTISLSDVFYAIFSFTGAIMVHIAFTNISKLVKSRIGKDKWNVENESFEQSSVKLETPFSVNIPMKYYYKGKVRTGWINLVNPFRGNVVIGTPGSGKSFSVVNPFIRQLLAKGFSMMVYDFKFPDLAEITYLHYLMNKKEGILKNHSFHVINLNDVEKSRRINPLRAEYITTLADAAETAEALVEALRKGEKSGGGTDQFFTQSAINFLTSVIYFLSRYENGKYSTLAHVLAFMNQSYEDIFTTLFSDQELHSLLSPFHSAFVKRAFDQLEGQIGTLKINTSRLATKETFWVFSGDDFDLKISNPDNPSVLVLANDPNTQNINSACYSVILNRLTKLVNSKGNLPSALIIDEVPTLYIHRVENLIATARSNKVAVLMGLQELPQFRQQYGKETAQTIISVVGNVLSGSARDKETLDWLEKLFGKVKQLSDGLSIDRAKTSINQNEKLDHLIPSSKIANLKSGEMVGIIAQDADTPFDGKFRTSAFNCKINLNKEEINEETNNLRTTPIFYNFGTSEQKNRFLKDNFTKINKEVTSIIHNFKPLTNTI